MVETLLESDNISNKKLDGISLKELEQDSENNSEGISLDELFEDFKDWSIDLKDNVIFGIVNVLPVSALQLLTENGLLDNLTNLARGAVTKIGIDKLQQIDLTKVKPEVINELPNVFIENLSTEQFQNIGIDKFSNEQLGSLSKESVQTLSAPDVQNLAANGRLSNINPNFISPESLKGWDDYSKLPPEYISYIPAEEFKTINISNFSKEQLNFVTKEQLSMMPYEQGKEQGEKKIPDQINWDEIKNDALEAGAWGAGFGVFYGPKGVAIGASVGAGIGAVGEATRQIMIHNGYSEETAQVIETGINFIGPAGGAKTLLKEGGGQVLKHGDEIIDVAKNLDNKIPDGIKNYTDELVDRGKTILPKENGKWSKAEGDSQWIPDKDFVPKRPLGNELTNKEIFEKYGVYGVKFKKGEPDFTPFSKGSVEIDNFTSERALNFTQAEEKLAKEWSSIQKDGKVWTPQDVKGYRKDNNLTWHERSDIKTLDLVPEEIHGNIPHSGGISKMKQLQENKV